MSPNADQIEAAAKVLYELVYPSEKWEEAIFAFKSGFRKRAEQVLAAGMNA